MMKFKLRSLLYLCLLTMIALCHLPMTNISLRIGLAQNYLSLLQSQIKLIKLTRLVVVMHGRKRNAEEYRDQWSESAKDLNLLSISARI